MKWRQGGKVPHHIYEQLGDEPNSAPWPNGDRPVATFFNPEDAKRACEAFNFLQLGRKCPVCDGEKRHTDTCTYYSAPKKPTPSPYQGFSPIEDLKKKSGI